MKPLGMCFVLSAQLTMHHKIPFGSFPPSQPLLHGLCSSRQVAITPEIPPLSFLLLSLFPVSCVIALHEPSLFLRVLRERYLWALVGGLAVTLCYLVKGLPKRAKFLQITERPPIPDNKGSREIFLPSKVLPTAGHIIFTTEINGTCTLFLWEKVQLLWFVGREYTLHSLLNQDVSTFYKHPR